jgi:hypothetical protein
VGVGKIARDQHLPAIAATPNCRLVATADPNATLPDVPSYKALDAMLDAHPEIAAVAICTPTHLRHSQVRAALMRGKHVLLEMPPEALIKQGVESLPCLGDGRQSGTSGSPSILIASPEAATGGGLALLESGDWLRVDIGRGEVRLKIDDDELKARREWLEANGGYRYPGHQTPWQEIQRTLVEPLGRGMTLEPATKYRDVARRSRPCDKH